jgi:apolipoprotein N-acyltransferase
MHSFLLPYVTRGRVCDLPGYLSRIAWWESKKSVHPGSENRKTGVRRVVPFGLRLVACVATGVLLAVAQPPWDISPLAFVALTPLLVATRGECNGSCTHGSILGLVAGAAHGVVLAYWIPSALQSIGASSWGARAALCVTAFWGKGVPFLVVGCAASLIAKLPRGSRGPAFMLAVASIEAAVSRLPSGIPWSLLGHSQHEVDGLAQLAALGGVPLLSGLVAWVNWELVELRLAAPTTRTSAAARLAALAGALGLCALLGTRAVEWTRAGGGRGGHPALQLLVIQPDIDPAERWNPETQRTNLALVAALTHRELARYTQKPDVVVWPETLVTSPIDSDRALRADLEAAAKALGAPLVLGVTRSPLRGGRRSYRNSVLWLDPGNGVVDAFDKTTAVPIVEADGSGQGLSLLEPWFGVSPQTPRVEEGETERPVAAAGISFAVLLCYEIIFPGLVSARATPDVAAILNLANDSWFRGEAVSRQQLAAGAFRAIEQRRTLVRVAHGGVSAVFDPYGRTAASLPFGTEGSLWVEVPAESPPTPLERVVLIGLLASGAGMGAVASRRLWRLR